MIQWKYKPSGTCPVQAEGHFLGYYFYFRARHYQATIEFAKTEKEWYHESLNGQYVLWTTRDPYSAGWLPRWFCKVLIWSGCIRFLFKRNKNKLV